MNEREMRAKIQQLDLMVELLKMQNTVLTEVLAQVVKRIDGPPITSPTANQMAKQMARKIESMKPKNLGLMDLQSMAMQAKKTSMPSNLNIPDGLNEDGSPWTK